MADEVNKQQSDNSTATGTSMQNNGQNGVNQSSSYDDLVMEILKRRIDAINSLILPSYKVSNNNRQLNNQQQVIRPNVSFSNSQTNTNSTTNQTGTQKEKSSYEYGSIIKPEEAIAAMELVKNAMNSGNMQDEYKKLIDRQRKADLINAIGTAVYNLKKNLSGANVVGYVQPKEEKAPAYEAAVLKNQMDTNQNMMPIYQTVLKSLLDKKLLEKNYELQKAAQSSTNTTSQTETEKFGLEGGVVGGRGGGSRSSDNNNVVYTVVVNNKQFAAPLPKIIDPYVFMSSLARLAGIDYNINELFKKIGQSGITLVDISKMKFDDIVNNIVKSGDKYKIKLLADFFYDMYQKYPNLYNEYDKKNVIDFYEYANELNKPVSANENNTAIIPEKSASNFVKQVSVSDTKVK